MKLDVNGGPRGGGLQNLSKDEARFMLDGIAAKFAGRKGKIRVDKTTKSNKKIEVEESFSFWGWTPFLSAQRKQKTKDFLTELVKAAYPLGVVTK